ncbi:hypothetical protein AAEO50_06465 [Rossellomorea oryzaecorticis]|uniref:Polymerase nucleotidyl transferase domain-containing protein n=1 Tax=Rossellomorea oryzaecorticis TaxID=1396505 RepID=A0ABU9K9M3_9BACI
MYTAKEREQYFTRIISRLESSHLIEGVVHIGSGVAGYKDERSDIDLMVAAAGIADVEKARSFLHQYFREIGTVYIKELKLREHIYLIIAILENGLEFNVSILSRELLSVKSPLWKVVVDKTGKIIEKMEAAHKHFERKKYDFSEDVAFDFIYSMRKFQTELKRQNLIYALKMLETMRDSTLRLQALLENKKLHQFKAYETLDPEFVRKYLQTYPNQISEETLLIAADRLKVLFFETINRSKSHSVDEGLTRILR